MLAQYTGGIRGVDVARITTLICDETSMLGQDVAWWALLKILQHNKTLLQLVHKQLKNQVETFIALTLH